VKPDLVIRGGLVVDGSGRPPFEADVAVAADRIVGVGRYDGAAGEVIDAKGAVVTPGFVDVHTHLDAQITWDPLGAPATWHGVTSVVMGNCGVGFAPCKPEDRDFLMYLMEGVEDVPAPAMKAGVEWKWESFSEYTRHLATLPLGPNVGAHVGHCALRVHAMGARGVRDEPATAADIAAMQELLRDAMRGGALGVSTSRTTAHMTPKQEPIPGTFAQRDELLGLGDVLGEFNAGVFELAPHGVTGEEPNGVERELEWMEEVSRRSGRPVMFGYTQNQAHPDAWRSVVEHTVAAQKRGAGVVLQAAVRGIGLLLNSQTLSPLLALPAGLEYAGLPVADQLAALRQPEIRKKLAASVDEADGKILGGYARMETVFVWQDQGVLSYETTPEMSIAAMAARRGVHPAEAMIDLMLERGLEGFFYVPVFNQDLDVVEALLRAPGSMIGLGDAGAHVGQTCDAGVASFLLAYWVGHRRAFGLAEAVKRLTLDPALLYGIHGRGLVQRGWYADLNVIDLERLAVHEPEVLDDFPTGARHLVQRADGYRATIVNGAVLMRDGAHTAGCHPGRVLRNEAAAA